MNKFLILASLTLASALSFASINLHVNGEIDGLHRTVNFKYNGNGKSSSAGPFSGHLGDGPDFRMFCVDLGHSVAPPSNYLVDVVDISTLAANDPHHKAMKLFNKFNGSVDTATEGAALQMAIWEVMTDSSADLYHGNFKDNGTTSSVRNLAAQYLSADLSNVSDHGYWLRSVTHPNGKNQDMMAAVPEPTSLSLIGLGVAGFLRRRAKKA